MSNPFDYLLTPEEVDAFMEKLGRLQQLEAGHFQYLAKEEQQRQKEEE